MICKYCNNEIPDSELTCPHCGETVRATDEPGPARRRSRARAFVIVLLLIAACAGAVFVKYRPLPMLTLVPQSAAGAAAVDTQWLWSALADVRAVPRAAQAIAQFEHETGLSLERDIISWSGDIGVSMLGMDGDLPRFALFTQVRDWPKFIRVARKLRPRVGESMNLQWTQFNYSGVRVYKASSLGDSGVFTVCYLRGWVVCGIGAGSVEKVIDTCQGRVPSLAASEEWKRAFANLPDNPPAWAGVDLGSAAKLVASRLPAGRMLPTASMPKMVCVSALTERQNELRLDSISVAGSDLVRSSLKNTAQYSDPIDEKTLARLPDGAFAVVLGNNPALQWTQAKAQGVSGGLGGNSSEIASKLRDLKPLDDVFSSFSGPFAATLAWQNGKGFGAVGMSELSAESRARWAEKRLASFATGPMLGGVCVRRNGAYNLTIPGPFGSSVPKVCWKTDGKWLLLASDPKFLLWRSGDALRIPNELIGASSGAFGNLKFLPEALRGFGLNSSDDAFARITRMGLPNAEWLAWSSIEPGGEYAQGTFILRLNWRNALKVALRD